MPQEESAGTLKELLVFRVLPYATKQDDPPPAEGGFVRLEGNTKRLFESAFTGNDRQRTRIKPQPFHFNFSGAKRAHEVRDYVTVLATGSAEQKLAASKELSARLSKSIDDRTGELLLTIGIGTRGAKTRCAIWAYPADQSLQFRSNRGVPEVREVQDAFSKSSDARKAAFLESAIPVGRNDLVDGLLVDRTAGRAKGSSDYWLRRFLDARIEVYPARGTNLLIGALKKAQQSSETPEEKSSVRAVYDHLLAGNFPSTSLKAVGAQLVGEARVTYEKVIPKAEEGDAVFTIDMTEVNSKIKTRVFTLSSGLEIFFPQKDNLDPEEYIQHRAGKQYMVIDEEIVERYYK